MDETRPLSVARKAKRKKQMPADKQTTRPFKKKRGAPSCMSRINPFQVLEKLRPSVSAQHPGSSQEPLPPMAGDTWERVRTPTTPTMLPRPRTHADLPGGLHCLDAWEWQMLENGNAWEWRMLGNGKCLGTTNAWEMANAWERQMLENGKCLGRAMGPTWEKACRGSSEAGRAGSRGPGPRQRGPA